MRYCSLLVFTACLYGQIRTYPSNWGGGGGGGSGTVTSVTLNGTARQITVSCDNNPITASGTCTMTLPANLLFPANVTFVASTTSVPSFNIPSGVAPTSPTTGDFWNLSGVLQFYNGAATKSLLFDSGGNGLISRTAAGATTARTLAAGSTKLTVTNGDGVSGNPTVNLGTLTSGDIPNNAANTSGTAANLSGTPTLPNGTAAATQSQGDNSPKIATTGYTDLAVSNAIAGVNPAVAVQAATTQASDTSGLTYSNGVSGIGATLTGANNTALTVDGFTFTALGQRILVKNDTVSPSGARNGVYYVTQVQASLLPLILTRALDFDSSSDINNTGAIPVVNGTANGSTSWVVTSTVTTVGTDPVTFTQFSLNPAKTVTASATLGNNAIPVGDGSRGLQTPNSSTTIDSSGNITTPGSISAGSGSGTAGAVTVGQGTAPSSLPANTITEYAPTSVTAYGLAKPGSAPSADQFKVVTSVTGSKGTEMFKTIPDCQDSAGNHLNYTQSTHILSCGTSSSGGGGSTVTVTTTGGSPSVSASTLKFPNGTVTDLGSGVASLDPAATGTVRSVPGLAVWLDASQLTGFSDGDAVTSWTDFANPAGYSAASAQEASSSHYPVYKTSILNSKPIVRFDGSGWYRHVAPFDAGQYSVFLVAKLSSLSNSYTALLGYNFNTDNGGWFVKSSGKTALYNVATSEYDGSGSATLNNTTYYVLTLMFGPVSLDTRVALASDATVSFTNGAQNVAVRQFMIGSQATFTGSRTLTGDIAEFIVYSRRVSDTERDSIESYLKTKYGL